MEYRVLIMEYSFRICSGNSGIHIKTISEFPGHPPMKDQLITKGILYGQTILPVYILIQEPISNHH